MKSGKRWIFLLLVAALILTSLPAYAHSAEYLELGGTKLKFQYSDGTAMNGAMVIVQDAAGEQLATETTNSSGEYDYADYAENAATITVNDGEGHLCTYEVPETLPPEAENTDAAAAETAQQPAETPAGSNNTVTYIIIAALVLLVLIVVLTAKKKSKR